MQIAKVVRQTSQVVVAEVQPGQFGEGAKGIRQFLDDVATEVKLDQGLDVGYLCGDGLDQVVVATELADLRHGCQDIGEFPKVALTNPNGTKIGTFGEGGGETGQLIVGCIKPLQFMQIANGVGKAGQVVLPQGHPAQLCQVTDGVGHACQLVGGDIKDKEVAIQSNVIAQFMQSFVLQTQHIRLIHNVLGSLIRLAMRLDGMQWRAGLAVIACQLLGCGSDLLGIGMVPFCHSVFMVMLCMRGGLWCVGCIACLPASTQTVAHGVYPSERVEF